MTKQIKIEELIPFMRDGWVAMDKDNIWYWFATKPKRTDKYYWVGGEKIILGTSELWLWTALPIKPAEDWTKSLIKVGGK